jgi:adenylosuccinate synthase
LVAGQFAVTICKVDELFVTKLDRLTGLPTIKVATKYRYKGSDLTSFPAERYVLDKVEPVYIELSGWTEDITQAKEPRDLPQNARNYLKFMEDKLECKITHAGVGARADQTIAMY